MKSFRSLEHEEFKVGDIVTYSPYGLAHRLQVVGVCRYDVWGKYSELPQYHLAPLGKHGVTSVTTGLSVVESKHYLENKA